MTTIAWDGKTLAADRRSTWGSTAVDNCQRKIYVAHHPRGRLLIGAAGITEECTAAWLFMTGQTTVKPEVTDFRIMAIDEDGCVFVGSKIGMWATIGQRPWAIGSGTDYALGAMAAGANARQAVLIAAGLDTSTGTDVDVLTLVSKSKRRA